MNGLIKQIRSSVPGSCKRLWSELRWLSISTIGKRSAGKWTLLVSHRPQCGLRIKQIKVIEWIALPIPAFMCLRNDCNVVSCKCSVLASQWCLHG